MTDACPDHRASPAPTGGGRWLEVRFRGVGHCVLMPDRPDLRQGLEDIAGSWSLAVRSLADPSDRTSDVLAALHPSAGTNDRFDLASIYTDTPLASLSVASAICGLLADALTAFVEANAGALTLHCGAVLIDDRLVALTGGHRAGKSTLVSRLSAEPDLSIFCDDVLPLDPDGRGIAMGIAPRLRLPLPPAASDAFRRHVDRHIGPADGHYGYLCASTVACHGTRAPLSGLVVLDRRESGPARLHRLDPDIAMQNLLARNMGDLGGPDRAFHLVRDTARNATCLTLVYSDLEDAVALLRRAFTGDGAVAIAPPLPPAAPAPDHAIAPVDPDTVWHRASDAVIRRVGGSAFLWRPEDTTLWQMNRVAEMVWAALEVPGSAQDVAEVLADLFPDMAPERISADVAALLGKLAALDAIRLDRRPARAVTPLSSRRSGSPR
jgi:hypothetical protein